MNEENIKEQPEMDNGCDETPAEQTKEQAADTCAGQSAPETAEDTQNSPEDSGDKENKTAALEKELAAQKDKYLRLMAEYDNFRKRSAKERIEITSTVTGNTLAEILPVFDNFERALQTETADESYKQGMAMIFSQMGEVLKKLGVEIIDPTGQEFDPNVANAVNQIQDPELGENIVAQTFQKGYKIGSKVIRYAMVTVANP